MEKIINIYKPVGLTPFEVIQKIKQKDPDLLHTKICYAGRLDPLAHGVLLLLTGENTKQVTNYLNLPKEYEFEVAFGLQTDTYDLLGYVMGNYITTNITNVKLFVNTFVNKFIGKRVEEYPPYSSKTVGGKPLFWWARNNRLAEIEIPKRDIEIYDFRCLTVKEIDLRSLEKRIKETLALVNGDFRQHETIKRWEKLFSKSNTTLKLTTAKFYIRCSSGTYVRELVNQMGKEMGYGAVAIEILRTKVGNFSLTKAVSL
jgi:tRNA pseudouridine55 synthase